MANIKQIAADVVQRARAGDENAMALIACTREDSLKPEGEQARQTIKAILAYCDANPVSMSIIPLPEVEPIDFGAETTQALGQLKSVTQQMYGVQDPQGDRDHIYALAECLVDLSSEQDTTAGRVGSVIIANGPPLIIPRVECLISAFPNETVQSVIRGTMNGNLDPNTVDLNLQNVVFIGKIVGRARVLQLVRRTPKAIPIWCSRSAFEVGCG